jgi:hypothetical protein
LADDRKAETAMKGSCQVANQCAGKADWFASQKIKAVNSDMIKIHNPVKNRICF